MASAGARLREERERLGVSQTELGAIGGVRTQAQSLYESSKRSPDADYLALIASAGVDVCYVVTGKRGVQGELTDREQFAVSVLRSLDPFSRDALMVILERLAGSPVAMKRKAK